MPDAETPPVASALAGANSVASLGGDKCRKEASAAARYTGAPRLELRDVTKRFPGTLACDAVDLALGAGEIHALVGENGAGKSTAVAMMVGLLEPDAGERFFEGKPLDVTGPRAARALGIGVVFQHFSLFESLSVVENVALGLSGAESLGSLSQRIVALGERYGLAVDPDRPVLSLSVGERQRVEIVRALLERPRLLIMDEPTSVLTPAEADRLGRVLRQLRDEGTTILFISHKLDEVLALADRITVMRGGRVVATRASAQEDVGSLARLMIGEDLAPARRAGERTLGDVRLAARGISMPSESLHGTSLHDVRFELRAGEILGIAGIAGNGQGELMSALIGERRTISAGALELDGEAIGHLGPRARRRRGLAAVPEQRLGHAAVPAMNLAENGFLSAFDTRGLLRGGFIRRRQRRTFAAEVIAAHDVRTPGVDALATTLSGGNLQRFITGRELAQAPRVLVAAQPTWGVDAGAAAAIHRALLELAERGAAALVISQELDELLALSDRIAVLARGRLSEAYAAHTLDAEQLGSLMAGIDADSHSVGATSAGNPPLRGAGTASKAGPSLDPDTP